MLAALLEKHSGFVPFVAHFENEEVDSSARNKTVATSTGAPTAQQDAAGAVAGKGGQPARKRSKKAAATAEAEPGSRTATPAPDEEGAATTAAAAAAGAPPAATTALAVGGLDFTRYKLYLRELELEVFQVSNALSAPLVLGIALAFLRRRNNIPLPYTVAIAGLLSSSRARCARYRS